MNYRFLAVTALLSLLVPGITRASIASQTAGYIVLDVEQNGEAWYVDPVTTTRYSLGRPDDAYEVMRSVGLGITNTDLAMIPVEGTSTVGDASLQSRLSGRILLQVESHGEAWYVYPKTQKRTYLGRAEDAFTIMSSLGLGMSSANLALIPVAGTTSVASSSSDAWHEEKTIATSRGSFTVDLVTLRRQAYKMVTDTAENADCENNCTTLSLADFAARNSATIGIHGTYFCPKDYSSCSGKTGTFDGPVWNDRLGVMLNESDLPYNAGAMMVSDEDGNLSFGHRAKDLGTTVAAVESNIGGSLSAGIANYPSLIENGTNIVSTETVSTSQQSKSSRGGIGYDDEYIYLVIAHSASVTDLASIFETFGADYAMNLDGGATSALLYEHSYVYGPNRTLPNAILFQHR